MNKSRTFQKNSSKITINNPKQKLKTKFTINGTNKLTKLLKAIQVKDIKLSKNISDKSGEN